MELAWSAAGFLLFPASARQPLKYLWVLAKPGANDRPRRAQATTLPTPLPFAHHQNWRGTTGREKLRLRWERSRPNLGA